MVHKEDGFTILELLLVLSIVMIMSAIIIPAGAKWLHKTEEENAIQSIVLTIHSLQSYAMAHGVSTKLEIKNEGERTFYIASVPGKVELSRKALPKGMRRGTSIDFREIGFHADGDIINSGRLIIVGKSGLTHIVFQFQRGRMIISERARSVVAGNNSNAFSSHRDFQYATPFRNEDDKSITP